MRKTYRSIATAVLLGWTLAFGAVVPQAAAAYSTVAENNGFKAIYNDDRTVTVEGTAPGYAGQTIRVQIDDAGIGQKINVYDAHVAADGTFRITTEPLFADAVNVFVKLKDATYFLGVRFSGNLSEKPESGTIVKLAPDDPELASTVGDEGLPVLKAKWDQYKPVYDYSRSLYAEAPLLATPYAPGRLQDQVLKDALHMTKFARYLAGTSEEIALNDALNSSAHHKVVVLEKAYHPANPHRPDRPSDMSSDFYERAEPRIGIKWYENLHFGYKPMDAVVSFMDDRGADNRYSVGHRTAILDPDITGVGFGYTDKYTIMHLSADNSGSWKAKQDYIAWPAAGNFPTLFSNFEMFSVALNPDKYKKIDPEKLRIEVLNKGQATKWLLYDTAQSKSDAGSLYISSSSYAGGEAQLLTFGTPYLRIQAGDEVRVRISGLQDAAGNETSIEYTTRFVDLEPGNSTGNEGQTGGTTGKGTEEQNGGGQSDKPLEDLPIAKFSDIGGHWAREAIAWGVNLGIVQGYDDGTFRPDRPVSEAEFLALFYRPRVDPAMIDTDAGFTGRWDDRLYEFAQLYNVPVLGADDLPARDRPITRARVAEIIAAADGVNFSGDDAIRYLLGKGYAEGKSANTVAGFQGGDTLTRAEALTFSHRLRETIRNVQKRPAVPTPVSELPKLP